MTFRNTILTISLLTYGVVAFGQVPQWTVYNNSNSGIGGDNFNSVIKDLSGNIWVGKFDGGIAKFNGTTWTSYDTSIASGILYVMGIAVDHSNNIWVATQADGVLKFDGSHWTVYNSTNSGLAGDYVWTVAIDLNDDKWFGTLLNGVSKFDNTTWTTYDMSNSPITATQIETIEIDKRGRKNIGTAWGGYDRFKGSSWEFYSTGISTTDDIHCIEFDLDSSMWFGTHGGVIQRDSGNTTSTIYDMSNSAIPSNDIHSVGVAADGTKWIGTENAGLAKFDGTNWTNYNMGNSGLPHNWIGDIFIDTDQSIWLATDSGLAVLRFSTSVNSISSQQNSVSFFPNPFNQSTTLEFDNPKNENFTFSMLDNLGRVVQTIDNITTDRIKIERNNLSSGLYFFRLQTDKKIYNGKLTIE